MTPHPRMPTAAPRHGQDTAATSNGQDYLTPAQFAHAVGVNTRTVRNWIKTDFIHATRVGPRPATGPQPGAPARPRGGRGSSADARRLSGRLQGAQPQAGWGAQEPLLARGCVGR